MGEHGEYAPDPVWVPVTAHRDPKVAKAMFGLTVPPQPTSGPFYTNDQPET